MSENILGPDLGYVDLLNVLTTEKLQKDIKDGKHFQKSPLRPSAAGECTRALFYSLMAYHKKATYTIEADEPESHRLLNLGHFVETHVIRQFEALADFFEIRYKQQVLSFAYLESAHDKSMSQWLEGSLDLVFWSDKYKCVADIKSKKDKFSAFYKTNWDETSKKLDEMKSVKAISPSAYWVEDLEAFLEELNEPFFAANFLQLNLYANSEFLKERGINHACIIQYCKNDSRLREIRFKPSEKLYKKVLGKFQTALDAAAIGDEDAAPRDYALGNIKCAFCRYKGECWGGTDTRKAYFETFPKKRWPTKTARLGALGESLNHLLALFEKLEQEGKQKALTESAILKIMAERKLEKIEDGNGHVYEAKQLKERLSLRRSKA